jgi:hypothetical protein
LLSVINDHLDIVPNPAYFIGCQQDQAHFSMILDSLTLVVAGLVMFATTSSEVSSIQVFFNKIKTLSDTHVD